MKGRLIVNVDTEYQQIVNRLAIGLTVQMKLVSPEYSNLIVFLHPDALGYVNESVLAAIKPFNHPFAVFDAMGLDSNQVRFRHQQEIDLVTDEAGNLVKSSKAETFTIQLFIFFSYKDIEYLFRTPADYVRYVLPLLDRGRRIHKVRTGGRSNYIKLPWQIKVPKRRMRKGKYEYTNETHWHDVSIEVIDISAMQGNGGLKDYAKRVGIIMESKGEYSRDEKQRMLDMLNEDVQRNLRYSTGDIEYEDTGLLWGIFVKTNAMYNELARLIGVDEVPVETGWGFSTGAIVAQLLTKWIAKQTGISPESFYKLTSFAGTEGLTRYASMFKTRKGIERNLLYLSMVDGGRAVRERLRKLGEPKGEVLHYVSGLLNDIDISGCYGNGLRHQLFPVGCPHIEGESMSLREFLAKYEHELIPGLWYARVSWRNAPFKQDVLLSKVPKGLSSDEDWEFDEKTQRFMGEVSTKESTMFLSTRNVYHASLNHDLMQVLKHYGSRSRNAALNVWDWLLDNCVVEGAAIYRKSDRKDSVTPEMLKGVYIGDASERVKFSEDWVQVELKPLLDILITERSKHKKKTPMNEFLKLFINTIYGCIASPYFSTPGTGISNAVVGNNITARARTLAWCMAKGLGTFIIVTDGGVFDVNRVLSYKAKSLDKFASISEGENKDDNRNYFVSEVPLFGRELTEDELAAMWTKNENGDWVNPQLDKQAWNHLAVMFSDLDIFSQKQFFFESKYGSSMGENRPFTELVLHNKVDYLLAGSKGFDAAVVAFRGFHQSVDSTGKKRHDPRVLQLFEAIKQGKVFSIQDEADHLVSGREWNERFNYQQWLEQFETGNLEDLILPNDAVTQIKRAYSHTPLYKRFENLEEYQKTMSQYDKARDYKPAKGRHKYGRKPKPTRSELDDMSMSVRSLSNPSNV